MSHDPVSPVWGLCRANYRQIRVLQVHSWMKTIEIFHDHWSNCCYQQMSWRSGLTRFIRSSKCVTNTGLMSSDDVRPHFSEKASFFWKHCVWKKRNRLVLKEHYLKFCFQKWMIPLRLLPTNNWARQSQSECLGQTLSSRQLLEGNLDPSAPNWWLLQATSPVTYEHQASHEGGYQWPWKDLPWPLFLFIWSPTRPSYATLESHGQICSVLQQNWLNMKMCPTTSFVLLISGSQCTCRMMVHLGLYKGIRYSSWGWGTIYSISLMVQF